MWCGSQIATVDLRDEARAGHRNHRTGRLLPRRAPAREGLRGARHGAPLLDGEVRPHRPHQGPGHAAPGRPARSSLPDRRAEGVQARRDLQPRRDELRRAELDPADADRGVHRRRRHARPRGDARGVPGGPLLPGVELGDVRHGPGDAADREDPLLPALAVRRGEGLRPLDHGELPRVLRPFRLLRHTLQPRISPAAGSSS